MLWYSHVRFYFLYHIANLQVIHYPSPHSGSYTMVRYTHWLLSTDRNRPLIVLSQSSGKFIQRVYNIAILHQQFAFRQCSIYIVFSARQHICYSALFANARPSVRPSVPLSVPLSVTRVDQSKTVTVRITQPSPQSSPMTLVS